MFIVPWDQPVGTACKFVNYPFWLSDNAIGTKLTLSFNSPCCASHPYTFMQPLCFCELELMPGAVPWMPRCQWQECSRSRKPQSCSQTRLISQVHHIRGQGFKLSQHNTVVTVHMQVFGRLLSNQPIFTQGRNQRLVNFLRGMSTEELWEFTFQKQSNKHQIPYILTK